MNEAALTTKQLWATTALEELVKKVWKENQKRYQWSDGGQLDKTDGEDVQRNNKSILSIQA